MKFKNTPPDGGSYEKPPKGKYLGVIVGFANLGVQPGSGQYPAKQQVMIRCELHKRKGPSVDSAGFVHTVTMLFGATVRGENSKLRKALEAFGVPVPEGGEVESRDWLGKAAWLDVDHTKDGKHATVTAISKLDPEDDVVPEAKLTFEHWEGAPDEGDCPRWCAWAVARSTDLNHRAPEYAGGKAAANGEGAVGRPAPAEAAVASATDDDDDDFIPF